MSKSSRRNFVKGLSVTGLASAAVARSAGAAPMEMQVERSEVTGFHRLEPVPSRQVKVEDEFWSPKFKVWQEVTIRDCFRKFENDRGGAIDNFDKVRDGVKSEHAGPPWYDGLIYEMIRGSADFMVIHPDPALEAQLDGYIARIAAAAAKNPNGYINTYTQLDEPGHEWGLNGGLQIWQHEVYNAGALVDAGIHYYCATGKTVLLGTAVKFANYMTELMGPPPKKNIVPCHSLPEEALVKLYKLFHEDAEVKRKMGVQDEGKYLKLAEFWIENRGNNIGMPDWDADHQAAERYVRDRKYGDGRPSWGAYAQDDKPVFEQTTIHGHAVRATLLCAGIAATADVNRRKDYADTANRLWDNMVYRRTHITGGVGAFAEEEKFGPDYVLPNDAYLETCAAVGASFFHQNMNTTFGEARFVDQLERALYNGVLCGVSLEGNTYFYRNPLESGNDDRERWVWHTCPCCPPMFLKLMGALPGYIYATDADGIYVNLFVSSDATVKMKGQSVKVSQKSRYPWGGRIAMKVEPTQAVAFHLLVRVPEWCRGAQIAVNGKPVAMKQRVRGYVQIERTWKPGDEVSIVLPMDPEVVKANPMVLADAGKAALMRGPLVYCLESADGNPVRHTALPENMELVCHHDADKLKGVTVITGAAKNIGSPTWTDNLYAAAKQLPAPKDVHMVAIPYYANANRGPVDMAVWLPQIS